MTWRRLASDRLTASGSNTLRSMPLSDDIELHLALVPGDVKKRLNCPAVFRSNGA